jgi:2-polyprenyl-6-methoxyphenol hydroxylase-like FAD-dependent oxidoreductase
MIPEADVLVVGAGPTGLLAAGDLAADLGCCTVLERRGTESNLSRAAGVNSRTLEELDARGIADDMVQAGLPVDTIDVFGDMLGMSGLPSRFPFELAIPQYKTEQLLDERARALGAEIVSGAEVVGLSQDADGVDLQVRDQSGEVHTRRARYVVGADGVRSAVRTALGLPFPGRAAARSVILCDTQMTDPPPNRLAARTNEHGFAFVLPFGDGFYRLLAWDRSRELPDTAPVDLDEIRGLARRVLGTDFGMHDPRWLSRFHSEERLVPRYRVGRVFLAGDAAHTHSPAGGLGMNTGMQDAANIGWKLGAVVAGRAPAALLDTYDPERRPAGQTTVRISSRLLRAGQARPRTLGAARRAALRAATHVPPLARRMARAFSGIDVSYPAPPGAHPLTGRRAPDIPLSDHGTRRLYQALRCRRMLLVTPPNTLLPAALTAGWKDRVKIVGADGPTDKLVLVRPDGYIAWAAPYSDSGGIADRIHAALAEWCGPPADRQGPGRGDPGPHITDY